MTIMGRSYFRFTLLVTILLVMMTGCKQLEAVDTPEERLKQGIQSYHDEEPKTAESILTRVIREDTSYSRAYEFRAKARYDLKKYEQALSDINRAIEFRPDRGELYYLRGVIRSSLNQDERALSDYERAVEKGVKPWLKTRAYYNQGVTLEDFGDTDQAIERYNHALQSDSTFWRAHLNMISLLRYKGEYQKGIHHSSRVIQLTLGSTKYTGFLRRSTFYFLLGDYRKALRDVNRILRKEPDHFKALLLRAILFGELGRYQRGLTDADKAIGIKPENPAGYTIKGLVFLRQGEHQKALSAAEQALSKQREEVGAETWLIRARVHLQKGNLSQALDDSNRAIEELPGRPHWYWHKGDAYYTKARILKKMDRNEDAREAIDKAIKIDPGDTSFQKFRKEMTADRKNALEGRVVG